MRMKMTSFPTATGLFTLIATLGACGGDGTPGTDEASSATTSTGSGGSSTGGAGGVGGNGTSSSTSGTGTGGSPNTGPAQAAWSALLLSNGGACSITSQTGNMGAVTSGTKSKLLVDGGPEFATITCAVKGTTTFSVHAKASDQDVALTIDVPTIDASATAATPAKGIASFAGKNTGGAYTAPDAMPCDFYFKPGTGESVAPGRVWVTFVCPTIVKGQSTCELQESVAAFESCSE